MYTIKEYAKVLGVSTSTLRRWESEGKITSERTVGNHRRYGVTNNINSNKKTICYARVSTSRQKEDLIRQKQVLELYCASHGYSFDIIEDLGSGLNYNKKGLNKLIELIHNKSIDRLIVTNKDRLLRFGKEIIFKLCELNEIEVVVINSDETMDSNKEFVNDVLEIITHFSAKLYGKRSHMNEKILKENKKLFGETN
jgi:putative resolvase